LLASLIPSGQPPTSQEKAVGVAQRILIIAWSMLRNGVDDQERGAAKRELVQAWARGTQAGIRLEGIGLHRHARLSVQGRAAEERARSARTLPQGREVGLADRIHVRPRQGEKSGRGAFVLPVDSTEPKFGRRISGSDLRSGFPERDCAKCTARRRYLRDRPSDVGGDKPTCRYRTETSVWSPGIILGQSVLQFIGEEAD
jgi:hypothetical protein